MDSKGYLWIYGGVASFDMNAMWNYDLARDQYRWVAGMANFDGQYSNFGQMGVPSNDTFPGGKTYSAHAIDKNDNIWIYGGLSDNTLWMFNTTSLQFTWVGGNSSNEVAKYGELGMASEEYWPGQLVGARMVVDSKNNLWLFGGYIGQVESNGVWHYNTTSGMWSLQWGDPTATPPSSTFPDYQNKIWPGRWGPGCTIDEDDRVWLFGGSDSSTAYQLWNDLWSFDTRTITWRVDRDADASTLSGSMSSFDTYSIYNYPTQRDAASMVDRRDGTFIMYGGRNKFQYTVFDDVWIFNKTSSLWKYVHGNGTQASPVYGQYRGDGSKLGSRQAYGAETGLSAKGNLIIFGGNDFGTVTFNDIWIIPQDQCAMNLHNCDPNATCATTSWTYTCTCNEGYVGDGKTCTVPVPQAPTSTQPISNPTPTKAPTAKTTSGSEGLIAFSFTLFAALIVLL